MVNSPLWKELKKYSYKNYTCYIYGKYTENYPTEIKGKVVYKESIETKIEIMNPSGDIVYKMDWSEMYHRNKEKYHHQYLIRFRLLVNDIWYYLKHKDGKIVHIEEDYQRVLNDWTTYTETIIDRLIHDYEKEIYEQQMTDGLPDSVFIKYLDR